MKSSSTGAVLLAAHATWPIGTAPTLGTPQRGWLLILTVAGTQPLVVRGTPFKAEVGALLLVRKDSISEPAIPSNKPPADRWECFYVHFEPWPDWTPPASFARLGDGIYRATLTVPATGRRIQGIFNSLVADAQGEATIALLHPRPTRALDTFLNEILMTMLREILLRAEHQPSISPLDPRIRASVHAMATDPSGTHTVSSLAERVGLSTSRFSHLFHAATGMSPVHALRLRRLRQAALNLQYSENSIGDVAEAVGFSSIGHLSREFKRYFGVSPRSYRLSLGSHTALPSSAPLPPLAKARRRRVSTVPR